MNFPNSRAKAHYLTTQLWPASVIAVLASMGPANAQTFGFGPANRCASLGEDFVAIADSTGCMRIGGHVRVDIAKGRAAPAGYAAARDGVRQAAEQGHVRANSSSGWTDLFPR